MCPKPRGAGKARETRGQGQGQLRRRGKDGQGLPGLPLANEDPGADGWVLRAQAGHWAGMQEALEEVAGNPKPLDLQALPHPLPKALDLMQRDREDPAIHTAARSPGHSHRQKLASGWARSGRTRDGGGVRYVQCPHLGKGSWPPSSVVVDLGDAGNNEMGCAIHAYPPLPCTGWAAGRPPGILSRNGKGVTASPPHFSPLVLAPTSLLPKKRSLAKMKFISYLGGTFYHL